MPQIHIDCRPYLELQTIADSGQSINKHGSLLAEIIFDAREKNILMQRITNQYTCFNHQEQQYLLDKALLFINTDTIHDPLYAGAMRKHHMHRLLTQKLSESKYFNLDGFLRFQIPQYQQYLDLILMLAADELIAEEEESEYLNILHEYLKLGQNSGRNLHIFFSHGSIYNIYADLNGQLFPLEGGRLTGYEDVFISNLLLLCPSSLTIHSAQELTPKTLQTIKEIFTDKIIIC